MYALDVDDLEYCWSALESGHVLPADGDSHTVKHNIGGREYLIQQTPEKGVAFYVWNCAIILATYLTNHLEKQLPQKRVIELGAGTGLAGLVAAYLGAFTVLTDLPDVVSLMDGNIKANGLEANACALELPWGSDCSSIVKSHGPYDYIIAADVIYLESTFDLLVSTLVDLCSSHTIVLLAYQKRRRADRRFFIKAAKCFDMSTIPEAVLPRTNVTLHCLKLKRGQQSISSAE